MGEASGQPPTWLSDQLQAAIRDRDQVLTAAGIVNPIAEHNARQRINNRLDEVEDEWQRAGYPRCEHLGQPQPTFLPIAGDRKALCSGCLAQWAATVAGTAEDRTCDFCRREVQPIAPFSATEGPITYSGGICRRCRGAED